MMADRVAKKGRLQSKKSIKHLLERQRRARINNSLSELKHLVLSGIHQENPQADLNGTEKMEKAKILELTVDYIKAIKGNTVPGFWKSEDMNFMRKRGTSCCECYRETEKKKKATKSKRSVLPPSFDYGSGPLSQVDCQIVQCTPCVDGKTLCSCFAPQVCGISTPPPSPSPSISVECASPYDERTECRGLSMSMSASPSKGHSTMAGQVWRPWLN